MDGETKRLVRIAIAWCGPAFVVGFIVFWAVLGHNVPPPNMMGMTSAQLISEYYGKYQNEIAIGMIGSATMVCSTRLGRCYWPPCCATKMDR